MMKRFFVRVPIPVAVAVLGTLFAAGLLSLATAQLAYADTITFTFNPLANNASDSAIQTYMDNTLGALGSITVKGAVASNSYNGDGHAVGPGNGSTSLTLGTSNGISNGNQGGSMNLTSPDTFIMNLSSSSDILMNFRGLTITSVSFDYEIFPDGTCATGRYCGANWPDFTFMADGTQIFNSLGIKPGQPGDPYTKSPASGPRGTEKAPQLLTTTGLITFPGGVTSLDFVDWPATIGIDNLVITTANPEPATLVLLGTGMTGLLLKRKQRKTS